MDKSVKFLSLNICCVIYVLSWIQCGLMWFESILVFILFKFKKHPNISRIRVVMRVREVLQYRESSDPKVIGARVVVKTWRKWRAEAAVEGAEARLRHKVLVGAVAKGRSGLGSLEVPRFDKAQGRERRQLIQDKIRAVVEERMSRAIAMRQTAGCLDQMGTGDGAKDYMEWSLENGFTEYQISYQSSLWRPSKSI